MRRPYRVRDMCAAHSDPWRWTAGRQHGPTTGWAGPGLNLKLISSRPSVRFQSPNRLLSINHASCFRIFRIRPDRDDTVVTTVYALLLYSRSVEYLPVCYRYFDCFDSFSGWYGMVVLHVVFDSLIFVRHLIV